MAAFQTELKDIKVDWRQLLTTWCWVGITTLILGALSVMPVSSYFKRHLMELRFAKEWLALDKAPPLGVSIAIFAVFIFMTFMIGLGYALYYRGIPGDRLVKGALFGASIWLVGVVPFELMDVQVSKVPSVVILFLWILLWLPVSVIIGMVAAWLYPKRIRRKKGERVREKLPGPSRRELVDGLWSDKWKILLSTCLSTLLTAGLGFLFMFVLTKPASEMKFLLRESVVKGQYTMNQAIGVGAVTAFWCFFITLYYAAAGRRGPFGGPSGGAFFGFWLFGMMGLPMMLVLWPVTDFPTNIILLDTVILPLLFHVGTGAIAGSLLYSHEEPMDNSTCKPDKETDQLHG